MTELIRTLEREYRKVKRAYNDGKHTRSYHVVYSCLEIELMKDDNKVLDKKLGLIRATTTCDDNIKHLERFLGRKVDLDEKAICYIKLLILLGMFWVFGEVYSEEEIDWIDKQIHNSMADTLRGIEE